MGPALPILVVKLGGSLLESPGWPDRLLKYLSSRPDVLPVLIVGGGRFADVLRGLDQIHNLGESRSHDLALQILDMTAQLAAALLPGAVVVDSLDRLRTESSPAGILILAPRTFSLADAAGPIPLPQTWATTTDSIAARVADRLGAAELVLLKSCPLPPGCPDWPTAARLGLVDPMFPRVSASLSRVVWMNLAADPSPSYQLRGEPSWPY